MDFETQTLEGILDGTVDALKSMLIVWSIDQKFRISETSSALSGSNFRMYKVFVNGSIVGSIRTQQLPAEKVLIDFKAVLLESKPDERFYIIRDALIRRLAQVGFKPNPPEPPLTKRGPLGF